MFINVKHLKPFDEEKDGFDLYERRDENGNVYIVAKSGMLIIGIISPFNIAGKSFLKELEDLTEGVRLALSNDKPVDLQQRMDE